MRTNNECEIELRMSTMLKFKYYGKPCIVKDIQTGDILRIYKFGEDL